MGVNVSISFKYSMHAITPMGVNDSISYKYSMGINDSITFRLMLALF